MADTLGLLYWVGIIGVGCFYWFGYSDPAGNEFLRRLKTAYAAIFWPVFLLLLLFRNRRSIFG